jgi:hypothetical protein
MLEGEQRRLGYNIGDLLNMPCFTDTLSETTGCEEASHVFTGSIVDLYCRQKPPEEYVPNIQRICDSTQNYLDANYSRLERIINFVKRETCLCVHLRLHSGDQPFVGVIKQLSTHYRYVLILSGIHDDQRFGDHNTTIRNFVTGINHILSQNSNMYFYSDTPDAHLAIMRSASHLMVHQGGLSALGAIVSTGQLFVTPSFKHAIRQKWRDMIGKNLINIVPNVSV